MIKAIISNIDGVLTNGETLYYLDQNEQMREALSLNSKDRNSIIKYINDGNIFGLISHGESNIIKRKLFDDLGIKHENLFFNSNDKLKDFKAFIKLNDLKPSEIIYVGDDFSDLEIMELAVISICPKDAIERIKNVSSFKTKKKGGEGVLSEIINDLLFQINEKTGNH